LRVIADKYPDDLGESRYYAYVAFQLGKRDETFRIYRRLIEKSPENTDLLLALNEFYAKSDSLQQAFDCLVEYERIEGRSIQTGYRKILYKLGLGDTIAVMAEIDSLIANDRNSAAPWMIKGDVLNYLNMQDSVLPSFLKAEELEPDNGEVKVSLAEYYQGVGDSVACDNKMYEALMCDNFNLEMKVKILADYLQKLIADQSSSDRGNQLFDVLREQYPHEPLVLEFAARFNAAIGDIEEAIEVISYAIDMSPENEPYRILKQRCLLTVDRYSEVIDEYNASKEYMEPSGDMMYLVGTTYVLLEDYDSAVGIYTQLIRDVNPELPLQEMMADNSLLASLPYDDLMAVSQYYMSLGDVYNTSDNNDLALVAYENSLRAFPENTMTMNNYAYLLSKMNRDLDKAESMIAKALEQEPENVSFLDTYAWVLFVKGDYEAALPYQIKAVELGADDPSSEVWHHMGDIYFFNKKVDEAVDAWVKALELEPDNELLQRKVKQKTYFEK
jgi:tetratricopeptide (TPR) repeat protein